MLWALVAPTHSYERARKLFVLLMIRVSCNFLVNPGVDVAAEVTTLTLLRLNLNINKQLTSQPRIFLASHQPLLFKKVNK